MRFWDSSAVVPLLVDEPDSQAMRNIAAADPHLIVWWATEVECNSALARIERESDPTPGTDHAFERLAIIAEGWGVVSASDEVKFAAIRFLRVHALRAADALQLGAAFVAAQGRPRELDFVTRDTRLAAAARKEGFRVVAPG